jgi:tight adherence protein B
MAIPVTTPSSGDFSKILKTDDQYGKGTGDNLEDRMNSAFDLLLIRSGMALTPAMFLWLSLCLAILGGGVGFVARESLIATAVGMGVGGVLLLAWALVAQAQRTQKMIFQLPDMIEELARAARTGRSVEQCFSLVAHDTPAPLGDELRLCSGRLELGVGMSRALADLPRRTGIVSLRIFVTALSVHASVGGDLISVLERLSRSIRGRAAFLARLRASTAASRATTVLMLAIPPLVLTFFAFRDPDYFQRLFAVKWGRIITLTAVALQVIGIVWVLRIMKHSRQS